MELRIDPLDPADDPTVAAVIALRTAADAVDVPDFPPPCPYAYRGALAHPVSHRRTERYAARAGDTPVGYLELTMPLRENLDNADVEITVDPAYRRRGIGRALYGHAAARLRELGRKRLASMTVEQLPGGRPRQEAGRGFATALGAEPALDDVRRRLDLATVDEDALSAMADGARARASGYRLVSWRGRIPDEVADGAAYLESRLLSDAPLGDLAWEPERIDVARMRESEGLIEACRFHVHSTGAVHGATGRLVALTTLAGFASSPWHAFQWITLVDPEHRGHRLGALVKVANLRHARECQPGLRMIDTWNAVVNAHMISINEAMGFRPVDSWINWQQDV